uniref:Uncharacterized protein n=1 Tax=Anguilla anguilla TaxID=7936 RepID=A0A0E9RXA8_ANGAN
MHSSPLSQKCNRADNCACSRTHTHTHTCTDSYSWLPLQASFFCKG